MHRHCVCLNLSDLLPFHNESHFFLSASIIFFVFSSVFLLQVNKILVVHSDLFIQKRSLLFVRKKNNLYTLLTKHGLHYGYAQCHEWAPQVPSPSFFRAYSIKNIPDETQFSRYTRKNRKPCMRRQSISFDWKIEQIRHKLT
jgi:hypothetical protein